MALDIKTNKNYTIPLVNKDLQLPDSNLYTFRNRITEAGKEAVNMTSSEFRIFILSAIRRECASLSIDYDQLNEKTIGKKIYFMMKEKK